MLAFWMPFHVKALYLVLYILVDIILILEEPAIEMRTTCTKTKSNTR